jgi:hypothetical protein
MSTKNKIMGTAVAAISLASASGAATAGGMEPAETQAKPGKRSPRQRLSPSKSCAKIPIKSASLLTRGAGSSNGSLPGLGEIGDWQKTSRPPSAPHAPSSTPHPSCCSCDGSLALHDFRNRLSVGNSGLPIGRECRIGDSAAQEVNGFLEGAIILLVGRYVRLRARLFVAFRLQVAA